MEVRFPPRPARTGYAWEEYARRHGDFALAGVAAAITLGSDSACSAARLVYTGVGPVPFDARRAAELLVGQRIAFDSRQSVAEVRGREIAVENGAEVHGLRT